MTNSVCHADKQELRSIVVTVNLEGPTPSITVTPITKSSDGNPGLPKSGETGFAPSTEPRQCACASSKRMAQSQREGRNEAGHSQSWMQGFEAGAKCMISVFATKDQHAGGSKPVPTSIWNPKE